jgi:O-antigen/teichoic acid export membrane protein
MKSIIGNFSVRFTTAVFNLLIAVFISQFLGAEGKGEQSLILAAITIVLLFHNVVSGASIVYLASRIPARKLLVVSYLWSIFVGFVSYLILVKFSFFTSFISISIVTLSILSSFTSINSSLLIGREKISKSNLINLTVPLFTLFFILLQFYYFGNKSISVYIYALFFSYVISFAISLVYIKDYYLEKETHTAKFQTTFKSLFFYGFQNQLAHVFQLSSFRISYFIIEHFEGKEAVGVYSNGISIAEAIWMITSSICLYLYSKTSNSSDHDFAIQMTEKLTKVSLFLSLLVICLFVIVPSNLYPWVFGREFFEMKSIILLILPGIWIYNYYLIIGHFFSGQGKYYVNAIATGIGFLVTCIAAFVFIPTLKIQGAAISASISYFVTSLIVLLYFRKEGANFVVFPSFGELKSTLVQLKKQLIKRT